MKSKPPLRERRRPDVDAADKAMMPVLRKQRSRDSIKSR